MEFFPRRAGAKARNKGFGFPTSRSYLLFVFSWPKQLSCLTAVLSRYTVYANFSKRLLCDCRGSQESQTEDQTKISVPGLKVPSHRRTYEDQILRSCAILRSSPLSAFVLDRSLRSIQR